MSSLTCGCTDSIKCEIHRMKNYQTKIEKILFQPVFQDGKCPYCNYQCITRGKGNGVTQHIIHNHPEKYKSKINRLAALAEEAGKKAYEKGYINGWANQKIKPSRKDIAKVNELTSSPDLIGGKEKKWKK